MNKQSVSFISKKNGNRMKYGYNVLWWRVGPFRRLLIEYKFIVMEFFMIYVL